jgi:hypothetical protein
VLVKVSVKVRVKVNVGKTNVLCSNTFHFQSAGLVTDFVLVVTLLLLGRELSLID